MSIGESFSDSRVDIIIPVYNDFQSLQKCLFAIQSMASDFCNLGIIVVDNGSVPPIKIASDKLINLRLIRCETPGSYAARNAGAAISRADVLVFLDADCIPNDGWLYRGLRTLFASEKESIVGGDVLFLRSDKPTPTEAYQLMAGFGQEDNIKSRRFSATANLFVLRSTFKKIGWFNELLLSRGDREWCWRALELGCSIVFDERAIVYTWPRKSLKGAITQARRVAGGAHAAAWKDGLFRRPLEEKKAWKSKLNVIFGNPEYRLAMKLKVLVVAVVILLVRKVEIARLSLGGKMERR